MSVPARGSRDATRRGTIAVIDVGSNSLKLLVGRLGEDGTVVPVAFDRATTRLGRGVHAGGRVDRAAVDATVAAMARFLRMARRHRPEGVFAFATWSLRRAANAEAVRREFSRRTGIRVELLTGAREARLAYLSAARRLRSGRDAILLDIGGGSTELVWAQGGRVRLARSLPLGALSLTERFLRNDPVGRRELEVLRAHVGGIARRWMERCGHPTPSSLHLVASGGAATTAVWMAREGRRHPRAQLERLERGEVGRLVERCRRLPLRERKKLPGLPADRADIVLAGLVIALEFMREARKRVVWVSGGGVREGALIHLWENDLRW